MDKLFFHVLNEEFLSKQNSRNRILLERLSQSELHILRCSISLVGCPAYSCVSASWATTEPQSQTNVAEAVSAMTNSLRQATARIIQSAERQSGLIRRHLFVFAED